MSRDHDTASWHTKLLYTSAQRAARVAYRSTDCHNQACRALMIEARNDPLLMTALAFRGAASVIREEAQNDFARDARDAETPKD